MMIRREQKNDEITIREITDIAFKGKPYSDGTEADAIDKLRAAGHLHISLVAEEDENIISHAAFSPAHISGLRGQWYGLGPVSTHPDHQGKGAASALIEEGLRLLKQEGASGCFLIGNPDFYSRLGFISNGKLSYKDVDASYVQFIAFKQENPAGEVRFSPGLE